MKHLFTLSLLIIIFAMVTSCKKAAEVGDYQLLDTGRQYLVKSGTVTVNTAGKVTFAAPTDKIYVFLFRESVQVSAYSKADPGAFVSLFIARDGAGTGLADNFGLMQFIGKDEYLKLPGGLAQIKVNDYVNVNNGSLLNATLNFPFSEVNTPTVQMGIGSAVIDLKLNKQ